jgi:multiple sugar transport system substrate-binding protein
VTARRQLRGIAWAHTRATGPLHVTAQAFNDLHPDVEIVWSARSLWAFGEATLDSLAENFDLIVLDHPMIGHAVERSLLLALDELVETGWLAEQADASVGHSHESYRYEGRQWAAAIDAACPVSVAREELLNAAGAKPPASWSEMLELAAAESGRVVVPLKPIDALSLFLTLCANQGPPPLDTETAVVVADDLGRVVLEQMAQLVTLVGRRCLDLNPIDVLNAMSTGDELLYCPHAYGYSNYAREGYAPQRLTFGPFAGPAAPACAGTTLGGAGLAVSAGCHDVEVAAEYLQWISSAECQRTTYVLAGGQPGNAAAWDDDLANALTGQFFRRTRETIERAYTRPRHPGMHAFQAAAAGELRAFLLGELPAPDALERLGAHFRASSAARADG